MKKIMLFDGQVFQSAAWDRGMGKYSLCLLSALVDADSYDYSETYILFTTHLDLTDEARQAIANVAPDAKPLFLDLSVPNVHDHDSIMPLMRRNKEVLDRNIRELKQGAKYSVDFVILSLFIDQVCCVFPADTRNILLFYDLIPLQYSNRYGQFHNYDNYLRRYKVLLEADCIWAISQTVADDLAVYTGIDPKKIHNINGAPIERGHQDSEKPKHVTIPEKFLLMPSGNDLRKNNDRAVQAVNEYNKRATNKITLVITSFFDDGTRNRLSGMSNEVVFTGNVSEGELRWLYENAEALLFVPEYEGLGLPILEAAEFKVPIICSNLTVFDEMSTTAFYNSNQFDPQSIAKAIGRAVKGEDAQAKCKEYPKILRRYTWSNTAADALDFLKTVKAKRIAVAKPRLAIFTPDPAAYSAIGKFSMHLHPSLSEYFSIDYFVEKGVTERALVRPSYLFAIADVYDSKKFNARRYENYDAVLYHVGNSEFHLDTIKNSLHLPGFAIMHDTNLKPIFSQELLARKYITDERLEAEQMLDEYMGATNTAHIGTIVNSQLGIITHSRYTESAIRKIANREVAVRRANLSTATPVMKKRNIESRFSIGFAGIIHPAKGLTLLDMIVSSGIFEDVQIYLFGIPLVSDDELRRIASLPNVNVLTNLTDFEFQSKLADIDVLVNYRPEYNGEASAATIEAMRWGVVPIVRKIGWFDELPDDAVVKINSQDELISSLKRLYSDPDTLQFMSEQARKTTAEHFNQQQYAKTIAEIILNEISENASQTKNKQIYDALHQRLSKSEIRKLLND